MYIVYSCKARTGFATMNTCIWWTAYRLNCSFCASIVSRAYCLAFARRPTVSRDTRSAWGSPCSTLSSMGRPWVSQPGTNLQNQANSEQNKGVLWSADELTRIVGVGGLGLGRISVFMSKGQGMLIGGRETRAVVRVHTPQLPEAHAYCCGECCPL